MFKKRIRTLNPMASNFFEQQDVARKKTGRLVALFIAAVVGIMLLIYAVVVVFFVLGQNNQSYPPGTEPPSPPYLIAFVLTALGVVVVVGGCSLYKITALRSGGGESVARTLGGRLLHPDATDLNERKILNVVEEMALASGMTVPPVYLMENEPGINAFAAGYAPESAVIGITRGAIEQLSRDELQGVVAHEFSHILNGDMRLNIRLMGVIFGIIAIAVIGRVLLRATFYSGGGRGKRDGRAVLAMMAFGVALLVIGGLGILFGKLIQSAVSRQREFLADASAVQFTRNPDSIGGALKRIGGVGSTIRDGHADEASHMFIASGASSWGVGAFATHPPIEERIRRIDPSWNGAFPEPRNAPPSRTAEQRYREKFDPTQIATDPTGTVTGLPGAVIGAAILGETANAPQGRPSAEPAIDQVGSVSPAHVDYMRELIANIPGVLKDAARQPYGARAVVYTVLLDREQDVRNKQLSHLAEHADAEVAQLTRHLVDASHQLPMEARLPLIDMAVPALREMSDGQYGAFTQNVEVLIQADGRVDLFEWTLQRLLLRHLDAHFKPAPDPAVQYYNLKPLAESCGAVLSALAHVGQKDENAARSAFDSGAGELGLATMSMMSRQQVKLGQVGQALDQLIHVSPREKKKLIRACALTIAADGEVTRGEGELMRAVADSLGVPMPPMLPGQRLV